MANSSTIRSNAACGCALTPTPTGTPTPMLVKTVLSPFAVAFAVAACACAAMQPGTRLRVGGPEQQPGVFARTLLVRPNGLDAEWLGGHASIRVVDDHCSQGEIVGAKSAALAGLDAPPPAVQRVRACVSGGRGDLTDDVTSLRENRVEPSARRSLAFEVETQPTEVRLTYGGRVVSIKLPPGESASLLRARPEILAIPVMLELVPNTPTIKLSLAE